MNLGEKLKRNLDTDKAEAKKEKRIKAQKEHAYTVTWFEKIKKRVEKAISKGKPNIKFSFDPSIYGTPAIKVFNHKFLPWCEENGLKASFYLAWEGPLLFVEPSVKRLSDEQGEIMDIKLPSPIYLIVRLVDGSWQVWHDEVFFDEKLAIDRINEEGIGVGYDVEVVEFSPTVMGADAG